MGDSEGDAMERKKRRTREDGENQGAGGLYIERELVGRTKRSQTGETWGHPGYYERHPEIDASIF